jgi:putative oxidoreductase
METIAFDPLAVLRILCGVWFIPHCIGKIRHVGPASQTFAKAGLRPPRLFVIMAIVLEVLAGLGLVLNIQPRLAAALAVAVLAGASYAVLKINGFNWRWQKQGPEYMLFWSAVCVLSVSG